MPASALHTVLTLAAKARCPGAFVARPPGWLQSAFCCGDGSSSGIVGRRFDGAGTPLGGEFQVNTFTTGYQVTPAVAADGAGNFVVVLVKKLGLVHGTTEFLFWAGLTYFAALCFALIARRYVVRDQFLPETGPLPEASPARGAAARLA